MYTCKRESLFQRVERILGRDDLIPKNVVKAAVRGASVITLDLENEMVGDREARFLAEGLKPQVKCLNLSKNVIRDKGAIALAYALKSMAITHLDLSANKIGLAGITAISNALPSTAITHLSLAQNRLGNDGIALIANVLKNTQLTSLDLHQTRIGDDGARMIADGLIGSKITSLNLASNPIRDEGTMAILHSVIKIKKSCFDLQLSFHTDIPQAIVYGTHSILQFITALRLSGTYSTIRTWEHEQILTIVNALKTAKVTLFTWQRAYLQREEVEALAKVLPLTCITSLDLSKNELNDESAMIVVDVIKSTKIRELDFSYNLLEDRGVLDVVEALKGTDVASLGLTSNRITDRRIKAIAKALEHTVITDLTLAENKIGDKGVAHLANSLKSTRITRLNLQRNGITFVGASMVANVLKNTNITHLSFQDNNIGNEGAKALANVLKGTRIISLNLKYCGIGRKGKIVITNSVKNTLIPHLIINDKHRGIEHNSRIAYTLNLNQWAIVVKFHKFIIFNGSEFQFKTKGVSPLQCVEFTHDIVNNESWYLNAFEFNNFYPLLELLKPFFKKVEGALQTRLLMLKNNPLIENVKLLLTCQELGLKGTTRGLLGTSHFYALAKTAEAPLKYVLHPAVYILRHQHKWILDCSEHRLTSKQLLDIFERPELDIYIREDQLSKFSGNYTKAALVDILYRLTRSALKDQ